MGFTKKKLKPSSSSSSSLATPSKSKPATAASTTMMGGSSSSNKQKNKTSLLSKSSPAKIMPDTSIIRGGCDSEFIFVCKSLATGTFSSSGVFSMTMSLTAANRTAPSPQHSGSSTVSVESFSDRDDVEEEELGELLPGNSEFDLLFPKQDSSSAATSTATTSVLPTVFIRTADLPNMKEAVLQSRQSSFSDLDENDFVEHVHKPSSIPPLPSMTHDPNECWVALDNGNGELAPLGPAVTQALVKAGLDASMDKSMWTANGGTHKLLQPSSSVWKNTVFMSFDTHRPVPAPHARGSKDENDVLVWSGTWGHKYYGYDLPAIRCEAIVNMSPRSLANLLVDSNRVKEYNKMSIGREDIMVLQQDETCVTKIVVGKSKPPMLSKTLMLKSLLHMEELPGGGTQGGYVVVSRAIAHAGDCEADEDPKVILSEMLMGLNIIRCVEGEPDRCILISLTHLRSPVIPMMMAKRLGMSSAVNFINDIRALC